MPRTRSTQYFVEQPAQLKALAAPARQEIIDCLTLLGPATIAEIAEQLGRPADALYFHVKRLLRVGLVVEVARQKSGRQVMAQYDVVAKRLVLRYRPATQREVLRILRAATRMGERDFALAYPERAEHQREGQRDLWAGRSKGWLAPSDIARINRLLNQLFQVLSRGKPARPAGKASSRQLMTFTFSFSPASPPFRNRK